MLRFTLSLCATSLLFFGCGDECEFDTECAIGTFCIEGSCSALGDTGTDAQPDDTGSDADSMDAGVDASMDTPVDASMDTPVDASPSCTQTGFAAEFQFANAADGQHSYIARASSVVPSDTVVIRTVLGTTASSYDLSMESPVGCLRCVSIRRACDTTLENCERTFVAVSGSLNLTALGAVGERFTGTVSGVFQQFESDVIVPDGETWCLENYAFDVPVSDIQM